jgi:DNA repair exonuclease SbcCD ATPase subunit
MSFESAHIFLENGGYVLVQGSIDGNREYYSSNGSGKSSIWEAISWCLTGDTIRGNKDVSNRYGSDGACVTLSFSVNGTDYIVRRTKDHSIYKTNLNILMDGKDVSGKGLRDGESILSTILPDITSDLIGSVILLGQGLPCKLSSRSPSGRKELLEKLTKSDYMIEDIKNRISLRKDTLSSSMRDAESKITEFSVSKSFCEKELNKVKDQLNNAKSIQELVDKKIEVDKNIEEFEKQIINLEDLLSKIESNISKANEERTKQNEIYVSKRNFVSSKYSNLIDEKKSNIYDLQSRLPYLMQEKNRLDSITDICPTCGQKIPNVVKVDTAPLTEEIGKLKTTISQENDSLKDLISNQDAELSVIEEEYKRFLTDNDNTIITLNDEKKKHEVEKRNFEGKVSSLKTESFILKSDIDKYNESILSIKEEIKELENKLQKFQEQELYYIAEKQKLQSHIDALSKISNLANRDFRGYLLSGVVSYINNIAKSYSERIFGEPCVSFYLDGNSLNITLFDREYESLSGGEKQKVDLIIQFAIRKMLCKTEDFSSNIIVLDEIFDNLDCESSKTIIDFIANELNDLETVFIITHHSDLQIPYDSILKVVKDGNISRVE